MSGTDWLAVVFLGVASFMALVVLYFALAGRPGVVSLSPPEGSPRWPVYGFFIPFLLVGFMSRDPALNQFILVVRLCQLLIVLAAFFISWRRAKAAGPELPPRV